MKKPRARVIVRDRQERILLVKSWFGRQRWALPGGGINRNESPAQAAVRELQEETGVHLDVSELKLVGTISSQDDPPFDMIVFSAVVDGVKLTERHNYPEIIAIEWWKERELPYDVAPSVLEVLEISKN